MPIILLLILIGCIFIGCTHEPPLPTSPFSLTNRVFQKHSKEIHSLFAQLQEIAKKESLNHGNIETPHGEILLEQRQKDFAPSLILKRKDNTHEKLFSFLDSFLTLHADNLLGIRFCEDGRRGAAKLHTHDGSQLIFFHSKESRWHVVDAKVPSDFALRSCTQLITVETPHTIKVQSLFSDTAPARHQLSSCIHISLKNTSASSIGIRCETGIERKWFLFDEEQIHPLPDAIDIAAQDGKLYLLQEHSLLLLPENGPPKPILSFPKEQYPEALIASSRGLFVKLRKDFFRSFLLIDPETKETKEISRPECSLSMNPFLGSPKKHSFQCHHPLGIDNKATTLLSATSRDGTSIPFTLWKSPFAKDRAPTIIFSYGAYGKTIRPELRPLLALLYTQGFHIVAAHIRGGGFHGKRWWEGGRAEKKSHSVEDLIAVATEARTLLHSSRLIGIGKSAGAWPYIASMRKAPTLFQQLLLEMPVVAPMAQLSDNDPYITQEFHEWGNPSRENIQALYAALDPTQKPSEKPSEKLPTLYIRVGEQDSRVPPEPVIEWLTKLARNHPQHTRILEISKDANHLGSFNSYDELYSKAQEAYYLLHPELTGEE